MRSMLWQPPPSHAEEGAPQNLGSWQEVLGNPDLQEKCLRAWEKVRDKGLAEELKRVIMQPEGRQRAMRRMAQALRRRPSMA